MGWPRFRLQDMMSFRTDRSDRLDYLSSLNSDSFFISPCTPEEVST